MRIFSRKAAAKSGLVNQTLPAFRSGPGHIYNQRGNGLHVSRRAVKTSLTGAGAGGDAMG